MNACKVWVGLLEREWREAWYSSWGLVVISRNTLKGLSLHNFTKFSNWCTIDLCDWLDQQLPTGNHSLPLQENWRKAHHISRNFGLTHLNIPTLKFPIFNDLRQSIFSQKHDKKSDIEIEISEHRNRKLIQIYLKLDGPNFNFCA